MSTGPCTKWPIVALDSGFVAITGEQIKRERRRRNLTQQQLAAEAGVSLRTIGRVERGELQESRNFEAITAALGMQTNNEAPAGKLLQDASMHDLLQRIQELYDDATRRATDAGRIYKPGAPELDEVGLLAGPTERTSRAGRTRQKGGPAGR